MKSSRQMKILEIIGKYEVETQEELIDKLNSEGYKVTQATISRDIRELKLTKVALSSGGQKYVALVEQQNADMKEKYRRILKEGYLTMDMAQNILVIKTVAGMAMAVAAALDAMDYHELVGTIAGDDTIMCAVRSVDDTIKLMEKIRKIIGA